MYENLLRLIYLMHGTLHYGGPSEKHNVGKTDEVLLLSATVRSIGTFCHFCVHINGICNVRPSQTDSQFIVPSRICF